MHFYTTLAKQNNPHVPDYIMLSRIMNKKKDSGNISNKNMFIIDH